MIFTQLAYPEEPSSWRQYKQLFISKDSRVIDYYQNQISHSEGQGYGMLLAVIHNDKNTFNRLWEWTKNNLQIRHDSLLAWSWGKRQNGKWDVIDENDASDGDILVAFALLKASEKWDNNYYQTEGLKIIQSIRKELAVKWKDYLFISPGYYGFAKKDGLIINPSYFIFPAYRSFAKVDQKEFWQKVYKSSLSCLSQASFSSLHLPADWIFLNKNGVSIYTERSHYFGYEAIRILLYLCYEKDLKIEETFPEIKKLSEFYHKFGYIPLKVNLVDNSISLKDAPAGFYSIYALLAQKLGENSLSKELFKKAEKKLATEKYDYYSFSLYLLAKNLEIQ